jgi:hypothetical protein
MKAQVDVNLANSLAESVPLENSVSVEVKSVTGGLAKRVERTVTPQAVMPLAKVPPAAKLGLQIPLLGAVANSLTVTDVVTAGVIGLLRMSLLTESEFSPFGANGQLQQDTIAPVGSNAYTFAQTRPAGSLPLMAPLFERLIKESAMSRFEK